ncbi:MAG TPA: aminopeptidase N [Aestuariivirgaceae bacterium]|jgi:aminopeptidase N
MSKNSPKTIHLKDYTPTPYVIDRVDLKVELDAEETIVTSKLKLAPNPRANGTPGPLELDGEAIELKSIRLDGRSLEPRDFTAAERKLTLHAPPARPFEVEIRNLCRPKANTELSGLYLSNGIYCTQCEAEGFRRITYFLDRPDVLSRYRVRIEADRQEAPVLLANGNPIEAGEMDQGRHYAVWEDPFPKPSYLFAMVAGALGVVRDSFTTMSGRKVDLRIYVEPGKEDRCAWAMESIKAAMAWDEKAFGREYDLDIFMVVAVSMFNMGAMENKGLNVFNDKYVLASPDSATDLDYVNIEAVIAHEYFHNWTGDRITCRDWFQLCLKEGLTVFRDQEFTSDVRSRPVKRIQDVRTLRAQQFPEDAGPLAHPVRPSSYIEINNFYTATVYEKGAEVVRMLKTLLGPKDFRKAMDLYFERHDGEAATVEDFVACMSDASGRDLSQFFRWYEQAGTPEITANGQWHRGKKIYEIKLTQKLSPSPGQPEKRPQHIPIAIGLVGPNGNDMPLDVEGDALARPVLELNARSQTFRFSNIGSRPVPSINRDFSAPVKLNTNLTQKDLLFLMGQDSDAFNRWEAGQTIGKRLIVDAMAKVKARRRIAEPKGFADALKSTLGDRRLEPQFQALMLQLPSEQEVASDIARNVDPQLVHDGRDRLRQRLGVLLRQELLHCWNGIKLGEPYSPDPVSAGKRALRHAALSLIAAAEGKEGAELAMRHFTKAKNMSDEIGALGVLILLNEPQREEALKIFFERHGEDHLLLDKWFAMQAQVPHVETVARVRSLLTHKQFSWQSPNRLRALIGTFASLNPVAFNAPDGSGHRLLADVVIRLDKSNPQVAARLAASFRSYKALDGKRRRRAALALESILATKGLSRDTYEIVSRSLQ